LRYNSNAFNIALGHSLHLHGIVIIWQNPTRLVKQFSSWAVKPCIYLEGKKNAEANSVIFMSFLQVPWNVR
jgi:hypothetical protein